MDSHQPAESTVVAEISRDIQCLRGLAIIAVLIFHLWDRIFPVAFLGVDVFFVISGYLMMFLMSKRCLSRSAVVDFYFRRLKRIVPTYLFTIHIVGLVGTFIASPFDYDAILRDIPSSALFISNDPAVHRLSYFDQDSKYSLFLHTWSLSTELQFYILFPLLFALISLLSDLNSVLPIVVTLFGIAVSFLRQTMFSDPLNGHYLLSGRLWQFFFGFCVHFVKSKNLWLHPKIPQKLNSVFGYFLSFILVVSLFLDVFPSIQITRFAVTLITSVIISRPEGSNGLSFEFLSQIGDFSYGTYLIHWPLIVGARIALPRAFDFSQQPFLCAGLVLFLISMIIGFVVEKSTNSTFRRINKWSTLTAVIGFGYLCIAANCLYLSMAQPSTPTVCSIFHNLSFKYTTEAERQSYERIVGIWETRDSANISAEAALELNKEMTQFIPTRGYALSSCRNKTKFLPSGQQIPIDIFHSACHERGNGTKNIVVFGNSHAIFGHAGIARQFRHLYSELHTIFQFSCVPLPEAQQQRGMAERVRRNCVRLMRAVVNSLRQWERPIDVIILLFGYSGMDDPSINTALSARDEGFLFMQRFYAEMSAIAREVVFVPQLNVHFSIQPARVLQSALLRNSAPMVVGDTKEQIIGFMPNARRHLDMVKCRRCVKVDWTRLWCDSTFCSAIHQPTQLLLFVDEHHCSLFGSLFLGDYLLNLYQRQISHSKTI